MVNIEKFNYNTMRFRAFILRKWTICDGKKSTNKKKRMVVVVQFDCKFFRWIITLAEYVTIDF